MKRVTKNTILVVIPYCSEGAQGRELEFAVAGWRRHFKERDYLLVLAGEDNPITRTGDDICCVPSPRVEARDGQYRQHLDYVSCFARVREAFPQTRGYVRVADDCYAVRDFDMQDILTRKCIGESVEEFPFAVPGTWKADQQRTRAKLLELGYPIRNYTTHLPQFFEWERIAALWERFDMRRVSYVDELLYYNIYEGDRAAVNVHTDWQPYKCGIYRANPRVEYIEQSFKTRLWITNSPEGYIPQLEMMLDSHYFGADTWAWAG